MRRSLAGGGSVRPSPGPARALRAAASRTAPPTPSRPAAPRRAWRPAIPPCWRCRRRGRPSSSRCSPGRRASVPGRHACLRAGWTGRVSLHVHRCGQLSRSFYRHTGSLRGSTGGARAPVWAVAPPGVWCPGLACGQVPGRWGSVRRQNTDNGGQLLGGRAQFAGEDTELLGDDAEPRGGVLSLPGLQCVREFCGRGDQVPQWRSAG
jgi:hypothetical protein